MIEDIKHTANNIRFHERIENQQKLIEKFINIGNNSSTLLLSLIEDILDLSKIEAGTFSVWSNTFCIADTIEQVYQMFESQWKGKHITLDKQIEEKLSRIRIVSDEGRIKQVLLNVVSNAFKFTFDGSISISAKTLIDQNQEMIEIWVSDTGVGIKDEEYCKLFTLFGMLDWNKEINPHGWGIGLTVSK